ncbi:MAG TPA: HAMP domain-containing sensor histidine kinase [Solirubrobacteraceae bacterium]|jgi:two-component system OmpR family sensor kinase|nr:HAMP domain-containing sensor histidine kinase [Solirubrobacteraceae bacterium]
MTSLRTRLLAGVLLLAAAGLAIVGAVTYAEQSSFLYSRVDQEARSAVGTLSMALDRTIEQQALPGPGGPGGDEARQGGGPGAARVNLPPGTYGQRRTAEGAVVKHVLIKYSQSEPAPDAPSIPAHIPLRKLFTVGSVGSSGLQYRAFAQRDPEDSGITIAAVPMHEVTDTLQRLLLVEALVIAGVLVALGATAFFVVRLGLRPLSRMEVTAGQIAAGELSRRVSPADGRTEVGRLGRALNAMLDRLERAFAERQASEDKLRQFLADASHELRTPLSSIRGYAELFRMGATTTREETELAMRRIEDESRRMGVLVEDLLMLARLDETPEPRREEVDVARMARDAVTDAHAVAPDREISVLAPERATLSADPHQLHQVLANLMRNALVHTPAGTPIEVTVSDGDDAVAIAVRDHGPGFPQDAAAHLFDRFWRAEGGRERGRGGAGLGLAIAREIVAAHGGSIRAANAANGGAEFTVELPRSRS